MKTSRAFYISSGEAAILLGCSTQSVRNYTRRGRLIARRHRHSWLYDLQSVQMLALWQREHPEPRGRRIRLRDLVNQIKASNAPAADLQGTASAIGPRAGTRSASLACSK